MYVIYSASRTDVISTEVYQGMTTEVVPMEEWVSHASFETADAALEALKEYKSVYKPGKLTEYFIVEDGRIVKYAEGLFTKKGKKTFLGGTIAIIVVIIAALRIAYSNEAVKAAMDQYWLYVLLVIVLLGLASSTIRDKKRKRMDK